MRWITLLLIAWNQCCCGETLRVTTWNLQWFPSGSQNRAAADVEALNIKKAASVLSDLNSDILILQEVRDSNTVALLQAALLPKKYHLAVCSAFKEPVSGIVAFQQIVLLSKQQAVGAWFEDWKTVGLVDPPRGFAFAAFRIGTNDIAVYGVHLKSNLVKGDAERETQLNILKRELSAEQLLRHVSEAEERVKSQFEVVVIGGDFNTNPDNPLFASEGTLHFLRKAGFLSGYDGMHLTNRITCPSKGRYPSCTFDYIFAKGVGKLGPPIIKPSDTSDHFPVTRTIVLP